MAIAAGIVAVWASLAMLIAPDDGLAANTFGGLHIRVDKPQYDQSGYFALELQLTNTSGDATYEYDVAKSFYAGTLDGQVFKFVGAVGPAKGTLAPKQEVTLVASFGLGVRDGCANNLHFKAINHTFSAPEGDLPLKVECK